MLSFSLHLPRYRLQFTITKRRHFGSEKGIIEKIKNVRQGSRFSRLFRHIFEHRRIKTIVGGNLAILVLTTSILSPKASALAINQEPEITTLSEGVIELTTKTSVRLPLDEIRITQRFSFLHQAIDFDGVTGDPVYPVMEGKIESIVYERFGLGNHIIINHGSGLKSIYAHLSKIEVGTGEETDINKVIGKVGATGMAFGDHLHFELIENDHYINPLTILPVK